MARFDQERASARGDNRRMTGNVNIYICSEALEKGKKIVESAVDKVSETTKINLNPSNVVSNKLNKNRNEQLNGKNNAANNREKLIMTAEFNESQSHEVKSRSNDTKLLRTSTSDGNSDEKPKLSGIVSCRCPQYDESDLWLRNFKNKRERKIAVGVIHEEKKATEEPRSSSKDKNLLAIKHDQKLGPAKHKSKVLKLEKKKKKIKEPRKSNENNTWFSFFRRKTDADAKENINHDDETLCTCKWKTNSLKNKNKKDKQKKRQKDKDNKTLISSKKTRKDAENLPQKISNNVNEGIKKTEASIKTKNLDRKAKDKHGHNRESLTEEKLPNKKLSPNEINQDQKLPKLSENQKDVLHKKSALKKNDQDKKKENKASVKEISFDTKKKKKATVQKVKVKNKAHIEEDTITARKSKSNANDTNDLKRTKSEDQSSFFNKFFNLFKSTRDTPQRNTKKKKSKCDESCSELKKTARTSSSVQRKKKSKRRRHGSELAGKINGQKLREKAIISSNKSNIQVNERKSHRVNMLKNIEETNELEKNKTKPNDPVKEPAKGNLKKTNSEESKTSKSLPTDYSQNSLRICFSCLFPIGNCLCKRKFPEQQSCDCRKVTFRCDDNCKPSNDKIPHGSATLPYQKSKNYPKVVNEMQGKMNESISNSKDTCCYENNHNDNERCTCEECDLSCVNDVCTDKKPRAKCYYCKNLPCRCDCLIRTPR